MCGNPYYRRTRRRYKSDDIIYEWKCKKYLETGRARPGCPGGCGNIHLEEEKFYKLLERVCKDRYQTDREEITRHMMRLLKMVLKEKDGRQELQETYEQKEKVLKQMNLLVEKLLDGVISDEIYKGKQGELEGKMDSIQREIEELERQERSAEGSTYEERLRQIEERLKTEKLEERAVAAEFLDEVEKIFIYPEYMEIIFHTLHTCKDAKTGECKNCLKVEYENLFDYRKKKREEREVIAEMMRKNPQITARQIAGALGISLSGANYRIRALKKEGKIRFHGSGGKGMWIVSD